MPDYGDSKGFGGSGGGEAATGGMGKGQGSGYGGGGAKGGDQRGKSFDSGYTPTQTDYLGTQTFSDEGGPAFAETKLEATLDQVVAQNPMIFNKVEDPTVRVDTFGNQQVYDAATGQYVGRIGKVGDMMRVPGLFSLATKIFGVNPDMPTFTVSDIFSKQSGLEREMGGGDGPPDDIMEILYPSEETPMEEQPIETQPVIPGYNLAFKDFYGQQLEDGGRVGFEKGGTELFERTKKIPEMLTTDELPSDPLSQIIKIGMTVRAPLMDVVEALGLGVKETTRMIADLTRKGFDVTKPARDAISGAVTSTGEFLKEDVGDMGRFVSMPYYLQRFGGQRNLSDTETRLVRELDSTVGRSTPERTKMLKEKLFKEIYGSGPVDKSSIQLAPGMVSGKSKTIGLANGGLASLPMNFNPMTNANPFSMMMRGGR